MPVELWEKPVRTMPSNAELLREARPLVMIEPKLLVRSIGRLDAPVTEADDLAEGRAVSAVTKKRDELLSDCLLGRLLNVEDTVGLGRLADAEPVAGRQLVRAGRSHALDEHGKALGGSVGDERHRRVVQAGPVALVKADAVGGQDHGAEVVAAAASARAPERNARVIRRHT